ncbi:hypothetical protein [Cupriavidus basilensis]
MLLVPRTCVRQSDTKVEPVVEPTPLSDTRALTAYVLLGDPGSGKTEAFWWEADAGGGHRISASDFLALNHPELQDSTLPVFIDGLDETRAGTVDGRVPLDNIRKKLQQLGCRSFRLSCRAADWLGNPDAAKLQSLLPAGEQVQVFTLHPLTLADVAAILPANHGITDPQAFITSAEQHGLTDLLFNPQTLGMLATAVGPDNRWPETRLAVLRNGVRAAGAGAQRGARRRYPQDRVGSRHASAGRCIPLRHPADCRPRRLHALAESSGPGAQAECRAQSTRTAPG